MKCRNCGAELPTGAMFCGECGATVAVPKLVEPATRARPGDTVTITPVAPRTPSRVPRPVAPPAGAAAAPGEPSVVEHVAGPEPIAVEPVEAEPVEAEPVEVAPIEAEPVAEVEHVAGPEPVDLEPLPSEPLDREPLDPEPLVPESLEAAPRAESPVPSAASAPLAMPPRPAPETHPTVGRSAAPPVRLADDDHDDVEATRIVRGMKGGERFVLQFSTGENSIVFGSGLLGRNPVLEPGESVDQLIAIVDSGKSVSKTHLEFGQIEGQFWVSDRFSANGTIVRQPDTRPQRLEPGRRQQVARGTRIDIGEQFFVVS